MSGHSKAVLWIGLALITLNLFFKGGWSQVWKSITTNSSGSKPSTGAGGLPLLPIIASAPTPKTAAAGTTLV